MATHAGDTALLGSHASTVAAERCAICFEGWDFVPLPCACQVNYCAACWDRALAASFAACGRPQCPTCRTHLRVDFDPSTRRIVFSTEQDAQAPLDNWRTRLLEQVRPVQLEILREYGDALRAERAGAPSNANVEQPSCVCGDQLKQVPVQVRLSQWLSEAPPVQRHLIQRGLVPKPAVACDICGRRRRSGFVWTCPRGTTTVLHAAAHDICERCFKQTVVASGNHWKLRMRGCCHSVGRCCTVLRRAVVAPAMRFAGYCRRAEPADRGDLLTRAVTSPEHLAGVYPRETHASAV